MRDGIDETRVTILREPEADALRRQLGRGPVVVVSGAPEVAADLARRADHAWGLVPPDAGPEQIAAVVRAVAAGFTVLPPALTTSVLVAKGTSQRDPASPVQPETLTPREREVLQRLAEGLPNRAIADTLGISDHTVKFHLASIFGKLGAGTRTEAVRLGLRQGLVTI
jgi:DNA-binding NarL/FixJ family response regulator